MIALVIAIPSFQPSQMIQLLGISSVAIGFAFKDILQNFLAGLLLLMTEPFQLNDQVKIGDFEGTVEDIQTRATVICTYDGRRVVIPNGEVFNKAIIVNTAYEKRRLEHDLSIGYDEDIDTARRVIVQTLRDTPNVMNEPEPEVLAMELGDSSIVLRARWWINPPRQVDVMQARDQVITRVKRALDKAGIEIPYPKHVVIMSPYETNGTPFSGEKSTGNGYEARFAQSARNALTVELYREIDVAGVKPVGNEKNALQVLTWCPHPGSQSSPTLPRKRERVYLSPQNSAVGNHSPLPACGRASSSTTIR